MNGLDGAVIFAGKRNNIRDVVLFRAGRITGQQDEGNVYVRNVKTFGQNEEVIFGRTHDGAYFILVKESGELIEELDEQRWASKLRGYGVEREPTVTFWYGYCYHALDRSIKGLLCVAIVLVGVVGLRRWLRRPGSAWAKRQEEARERDEQPPARRGWLWACLVLSALSPVFVVLKIVWPYELLGIAWAPAVLWIVATRKTWGYVRRCGKWVLLIPVVLGGGVYAVVVYSEWLHLVTWLAMAYLS